MTQKINGATWQSIVQEILDSYIEAIEYDVGYIAFNILD